RRRSRSSSPIGAVWRLRRRRSKRPLEASHDSAESREIAHRVRSLPRTVRYSRSPRAAIARIVVVLVPSRAAASPVVSQASTLEAYLLLASLTFLAAYGVASTS